MRSDEQLAQMFQNLEFGLEPPMASTATDDVRRARRALRRRRAAGWASGLAGVVILGSGLALALPGDRSPASDISVAGGTSAPAAPDGSASGDELPFQTTRALLLEKAVEHFDPEGDNLPGTSVGDQSATREGGEVSVAAKLEWTVPGESGMGLVHVAVTAPGYATADERARGDFAAQLGCHLGSSGCAERVGAADGPIYVADPSPQDRLLFSVVRERTDGSLVGVAVYDLFGNNSAEPVSSVDVSLDEALAFVADAELHVDRDELADAEQPHAVVPADPTAPAPASRS